MILARTQIAKRQDGNRPFARSRSRRNGWPLYDTDLDVALRSVQFARSHDSVAGEVVNPRQNQRDRKNESDKDDHDLQQPGWKKEGEDLSVDLRDQPADDRVCDRNSVNLPPLELGKKFLNIHRSLIV